MKKKLLNILLMLALIVLFISAFCISASAYDWHDASITTDGTLGYFTMEYGDEKFQSKGFDSADQFKSILNEINSNTSYNTDKFLDVRITLYDDMEVPDLDISHKHAELKIYLNGHKLTVTGGDCHYLECLEIDGGEGNPGTIDFSDAQHDGSVFTFDELGNIDYRAFIDLKNVIIRNVNAYRLFDFKDPNTMDQYPPSIKCTNVTFRGCSFNEYGGVFYIDNNNLKDISFTNTDFVNISNKYSGGAIYINDVFDNGTNYTNVNMTRCSFINCHTDHSSSDGGGGAIYVKEDYVYLGNSSTNPNDNNVCRDCTSAGSGGAIYDRAGYNTIQNFQFADNRSESYSYGGGAIVLDGYSSTYKNCGFYYNKAPNGYGGAIFLYHSSSEANITNDIFTGNSAANGHPDVYNSPPTTCCIWADTLAFSDGSNPDNNLVKGSSADDPVLIQNNDDLTALAVNLNSKPDIYNNKYYKLTANIENAFIPISNFTGKFDFDGHYINTKLTGKLFEGGDPIIKQPNVRIVYGEIDDYEDRIFADYSAYENGTFVKKTTGALYQAGGTLDKFDLANNTYIILGDLTVNNRINVSGNVNLIFAPGVTLYANNGINLPEDSTLSVYSQDINNRGSLIATATNNAGAGIGGNFAAVSRNIQVDSNTLSIAYGGNAGTLNIHAVTVEATGNGGAGIGGGKGGCATRGPEYNLVDKLPGEGGNGGAVNIYDAVVTATGNGGRDIGGGDGGDGYFLRDVPYPGYDMLCVGSGGGDAKEVTLYSGEIIAAVNGIGGGNAGSSPDQSTDYKGEYYNPALHSELTNDGGNGGTFDVKSGKVTANRIGGGIGTPEVTQTNINWAGGQHGENSEIYMNAGLLVRFGENGKFAPYSRELASKFAENLCIIAATHEHVFEGGCILTCKYCDEKIITDNHVYEGEGCIKTCIYCNKKITTDDHVFSGGCIQTCEYCNLQKDTHDYQDVYEWNAADWGMHFKVCNKCNEKKFIRYADSGSTDIIEEATCQHGRRIKEYAYFGHGPDRVVVSRNIEYGSPVDHKFEGTCLLKCKWCDEKKIEHRYDRKIHIWNEDHSSCKIVICCSKCDENTEGHVYLSQDATSVISQVVREATCQQGGVTTYTALFDDYEAISETVTGEPLSDHEYEEINGVMKCKYCGALQSAPSGFTLSGGNIWIIIAGAVVVLGGVAAIVFASKKKHL